MPRSAGSSTDSGNFLEVDEDRHVVLQQLRGLADRILRRDGAVGPDFDGQLVVVGHLAETGGLDGVVDLADRRVDRVDRDVAERQILVEVAVGADIAAARFSRISMFSLPPSLTVAMCMLRSSTSTSAIGLDLAATAPRPAVDAQADGAGSLARSS